MTSIYIDRSLAYTVAGVQKTVKQSDLTDFAESLVVLAEAGMGKSLLLQQLSAAPLRAFCTARQLLNRTDPTTLLGSNTILVIDALDEVSANSDGDTVDRILRKLGDIGYPRFVISCRVADWRSATSLEAIREQYDSSPLELHLMPFTDDDARRYLDDTQGPGKANSIIEHFRSRGLQQLLGNPQTLEMIARVASYGDLPASKTELFAKATDLLLREHKPSKAEGFPSSLEALDTAGAVCAAMLLTGNDEVARTTTDAIETHLTISEVRTLSGGNSLDTVLGSRLFRGPSVDSFSYAHRSIAEFVGATWLAKIATTSRKRRRLVALFQGRGLVPTSLRGIHAWLAVNPTLAETVIFSDPKAILQYADVAPLGTAGKQQLLYALEAEASKSQSSGDWDPIAFVPLLTRDMINDVRRILTSADVPLVIKLATLMALPSATIAFSFASELERVAFDSALPSALRTAAVEALEKQLSPSDLTSLGHRLCAIGDVTSSLLAVGIMSTLEFQGFEDTLIATLVNSGLAEAGEVIGVFFRLERSLPVERISGVLDCFVSNVVAQRASTQRLQKHHSSDTSQDDDSQTHVRASQISDFVRSLIARLHSSLGVSPAAFWSWLSVTDTGYAYQTESLKYIEQLVRRDSYLRRSVQKHVLVDRDDGTKVFDAVWKMRVACSALVPDEADLCWLLDFMHPKDVNDDRWKQLVTIIGHDRDSGAQLRAKALLVAGDRKEVKEWLSVLANPPPPEWEVKEAERKRERDAHTKATHAEHRAQAGKDLHRFLAGEGAVLVNAALAYMGEFSDLREEDTPRGRLASWLGDEITDAALLGFEVFLTAPSSRPSAQEIVDAYCARKHWPFGHIYLAALVHRNEAGRSYTDLSDERILACYYQFRSSFTASRKGLPDIKAGLSDEVRSRGLTVNAMELWCRSQISAGMDHIEGIHELMRSEEFTDPATDMAEAWIKGFSTLSVNTEEALLDRLLHSGRFPPLRELSRLRTAHASGTELRRWQAVQLIVGFQIAAKAIDALPADRDLIWSVRDRSGGRAGSGIYNLEGPEQLEWLISRFRAAWPSTSYPTGTSMGDTNAWDASEYIRLLVSRLGNDASDAAINAMKRIADKATDAYTGFIRSVADQQARSRLENTYVPPSVQELRAIIADEAPLTIDDLMAWTIDALSVVQRKIRADDAESWRGFYDDAGTPYPEERCRDHLLGLMRQVSVEIDFAPEGHVSGDKEVDIMCSAGRLRLPIEVKGQWHDQLWIGADEQLDRLYATDWRAESRGLYLVLWFGDTNRSTKALASPGRGITPPKSAGELQEMLVLRSKGAVDGRISIIVLDATRPQMPATRTAYPSASRGIRSAKR